MMVLVALLSLLLVALNVRRSLAPASAPARPCPLESEVIFVQPEGYSPIGTLSDGEGKVLQLYSRPSYTHRGRYNYHTMVGENQIPVELAFQGRRCENDQIGCDQVYSGDTMTASEFSTSAPMRVQLYRD